MNILMSIFTATYLVGIIIGRYLNVIDDSTHLICMGLWAIMFILNIHGDHNERW